MTRSASSTPEKPTGKPPRYSSEVSQTDWKRLNSMRDEDIDTSDIPEPTPEQLARAVLRKNFQPVPRKQQVTLRIDADVLDWFRAQGQGYQSCINALLRAYKEAHESKYE
jgi:uncharacterized protein (DUF4415 family)